MVLFVLNFGQHINHRVACQNAADAAAISAATQLAKSFNTIAADNVGIARELALVVVLDSQPVHIAESLKQAQALHQAVVGQLSRGAGAGEPLDAPTQTALAYLRDELAVEANQLSAASDAFAAIDVPKYTQYVDPNATGDPPHGAFWRAARDLARLSDSTLESAPAAAQMNAYDYGRASQADQAFAIPILPAFPVVKAQWGDWHKDPNHLMSLLVNGWLPENAFEPNVRAALADPEPYSNDQIKALVLHSGPFAKLFELYPSINGSWRSTDLGAVNGEAPAAPPSIYDAGGWYPPQYTPPAASHEVTGYRARGPVNWMQEQIWSFWFYGRSGTGALKYSLPHQFSQPGPRLLYRQLESAKLKYMFDPNLMGTGDSQLLNYHVQQWESNFTAARQRAEVVGDMCEQTVHFRMTVFSDHAQLMRASPPMP